MSDKPLVATDRAALILQLVPYLISRGEVSVSDAAADFDVTEDQMRAMVEKLTVIGLPGDGGFWQMANDLFDIDWDLLDQQGLISLTNAVGLERTQRLTSREAAALLAGLQLAASLPGVGESGIVHGLLSKLAAGASGTPVDVIVAPIAVDDVRVTVADALRDGVAVSFTYKAPDAPETTRTVDPVKVHIDSGQWYLQGWCHLRQAMRTFHLDRVSDVTLTDIPSTHGGESVPDLFATNDADAVVDVRLAPGMVPLVGDPLSGATITETDGVRTAHLRVADVQSIKRLAARYGGRVEVVTPDDARRAAAAWAEAGLAQYG